MAVAEVLVVDHHDSYTWNLVHLIASVTGRLPDVVQHDDPAAATRWRGRYSHLVLSPGPGTVDDPADFAIGRDVLAEAAVPVLGVCLGMQGIVAAYGGRVGLVEPAHGEVARVDHRGVGVFAGLPQRFGAVRYHSLAALAVPDELEVTAWCPAADHAEGLSTTPGTVVMAVQHRQRPVHGVQFHPESILTEHGRQLIENFLANKEAEVSR